jgi:hypothetical protein
LSLNPLWILIHYQTLPIREALAHKEVFSRESLWLNPIVDGKEIFPEGVSALDYRDDMLYIVAFMFWLYCLCMIIPLVKGIK